MPLIILFTLFFLSCPAYGAELTQSPSHDDMDEANIFYEKGEYLKARDIWQKHAEAGDSRAQNNLGILYDKGQGVEPDQGRALHWFFQAAKQDHPGGMTNYARMLNQGKGTKASPQEAVKWFDKAARLGQPEAQYDLGLLYEQGRGVKKDIKAACAWYTRAAAQYQPDALAKLGHLYRIGLGVPKDRSKATLMLYAAAMSGNKKGIEELEALAREEKNKEIAVLFGQKLDVTTRKDMRDALKQIGATIVREDDKYICDVYKLPNIIPGSEEMSICYGPSTDKSIPQPLGFIKIDYTAKDQSTAKNITKLVENRFGKPSVKENEQATLWNLGTIIIATQYMPEHKQASLMYMVPRIYHLTQN